MARKKKAKQEAHENHERWLVSYADFITLLFAFFVVMYAISSVNEGKYKVMSDSMSQAFKSQSQVIMGDTRPKLGGIESDSSMLSTIDDKKVFSQRMPLKLLSEELRQEFKGLIDDGRVTIREDEDWVEIELKSSLLFITGGADLTREAEMMLISIATTLTKIDNPVTVEGYTDNVMIKNALFPSNWELAASRAVTVTKTLIVGGVAKDRLIAASYADNYPVADNSTEDGRANNRRVVLLVENNSSRRDHLNKNKFDSGSGDTLPQHLPVSGTTTIIQDENSNSEENV